MLRYIKLSESDSKTIRFLSDAVFVDAGRTLSAVKMTRTGTFFDPRYGQFEISKEMLLSMVRNFEAGVYGHEVMLDIAHHSQHGPTLLGAGLVVRPCIVPLNAGLIITC